MKCKKRYLSIIVIALLLSLMNNVGVDATGFRQKQVIDLDALKIGNGKLVLTEDNKLYVTGQDYQGTFGPVDGLEGYDNAVRGFTLANTSAIEGKMIDISSAGTLTYILTDEGTVYATSYEDPVTSGVLRRWVKVDQSNFEGKPVTKIIRDLDGFTSFVTSDGSVYVTARPMTFEEVTFTKMNLPDGAMVSQIIVTGHATNMFLLDTAGKVWHEDNVLMAASGNQPFEWEPMVLPLDGQDVVIKQLGVSTGASRPFFLSTDGRMMYNENYLDLQGNSFPTIGANELGFTDVDNVDYFIEDLKYHSTSDAYGYPIVRKMDGKVYGSSAIITDLGGVLTTTDYMAHFGAYIPGIDGTSMIALYVDYPLMAGNYVVEKVLYAINGSEAYSNGVYSDPNNPIPPLTVTSNLIMEEYIYNPDPIIFDNSMNPKSAILGPGMQSITKVQVNWQITDKNNQIVKSGVIPFVDGNGVTLDMTSLNLSDGEYTLSFFREKTPDEANYLRSDNTSVAIFSIANNHEPEIKDPVTPPGDKPMFNNPKISSPKTGDESSTIEMAIFFIGAIVVLTFRKRKGKIKV